MKNPFISYRWDDNSGAIDVLAGGLRKHFGEENVHFDVTSTQYGNVPIKRQIQLGLEKSDVVLAFIGKNWVARLKEPPGDKEDLLLFELREAYGKGIPIIWLLEHGVPFPKKDDVPVEIWKIMQHRGTTVRTGPRDIRHEIPYLIELIEQTQQLPDKPIGPADVDGPGPFRWVLLVSISIVFSVVGGFLGWTMNEGSKASDENDRRFAASERQLDELQKQVLELKERNAYMLKAQSFNDKVAVIDGLQRSTEKKIKTLEKSILQLEDKVEDITQRLEQAEKKANEPKLDLEKLRLVMNTELQKAFPEDSVAIPPRGIGAVIVNVRTNSAVNANKISNEAPRIIEASLPKWTYLPKWTIMLTTPK